MSRTTVGTVDDYYWAFETLTKEGIPENHIAMLRAHFEAPNHIVSWPQLAATVGYANRNAVQLQYGKLARRVAEYLGIVPPPHDFWLLVLVNWAGRKDPSGHNTLYVLRPEVIDALTRLGILTQGENPKSKAIETNKTFQRKNRRHPKQ